jgi:hypothetical protein
MASVAKWLEGKTSPQKILVIISGGNLSPKVREALYHSKSIFDLLREKETNTAKFFDFQHHVFFQAENEMQNLGSSIR